MAITLGNGSITFGDGTAQTTKTPTVISAFSNDSGFFTAATASSRYAIKTNVIGRIFPLPSQGGGNGGGGGYSFNGNMQIFAYNAYNVDVGGFSVNCNCNCNC